MRRIAVRMAAVRSYIFFTVQRLVLEQCAGHSHQIDQYREIVLHQIDFDTFGDEQNEAGNNLMQARLRGQTVDRFLNAYRTEHRFERAHVRSAYLTLLFLRTNACFGDFFVVDLLLLNTSERGI